MNVRTALLHQYVIVCFFPPLPPSPFLSFASLSSSLPLSLLFFISVAGDARGLYCAGSHRLALLASLLFLLFFSLLSPSSLSTPLSLLIFVTCVMRNARRGVDIRHKLCAESHGVTHDEEVGERVGPDSPVIDWALCAVRPILLY